VQDQVLAQTPAAGRTVYEGTRIWIGVAQRVRWTKVLSQSGSGSYESVPFTVPAKWRIRYRVDGEDFFGASAEISWTRDGGLFNDGSFFANNPGSTQVHDVSDGAGTYRLSVRPNGSGTSWYVEVDALQ
jgi:hypothetical protein